MTGLSVGCLFSGVGGLELGFEEAGFDVVFQVEKDPQCQDVLRRQWPEIKLYDDITEVTSDRLHDDLGPRADVDVLVGGWPCQDISLAGSRSGLAGKRSGLFFEFARLAQELRPRWLVAENVAGLLSSYSPAVGAFDDVPPGSDQLDVEETYDFGTVVATLHELGYVGAWRTLDARHFGVPQRRRRVFVVGHLGAPFDAAAQVLFEPEVRSRNPEESDEEREVDASGPVQRTSGRGGPDRRSNATRAVQAGEIVSTLTSSDGGVDLDMAEAGHLIQMPVGVGSQSSTDVSGTLGSLGKDRGWNDDFDRAGAFIVSEPTPYGVGSQDGDVAGTLGTIPPPAGRSAGAFIVGDELRTLVGDQFGSDLARTLTSPKNGPHGDLETENFVVEPSAFRKSQRAREVDGPEKWEPADTSNTLTGHDHSVTRTTHAVVDGTEVRRLTPLEYERLQGFPDNWTAGQADSVRYRQIGNAVAVPVSRWVAGRVALIDASLTRP